MEELDKELWKHQKLILDYKFVQFGAAICFTRNQNAIYNLVNYSN